ncbi:glycoside hydrolase family 16 protein [Laccaria amethystina LaAM-08-1]|uniref:Glycoside hydrolase family 16 protein n=1 Tax=Laccaria amethystina LaAM-08-1 TaxID=1095629 RepID=A0A0C9XWJ0_9AGAR|nr:glycoside hydrolase family 16 protein [Laccaria amethystina LaAM-08-1]
MIFKITLLPVIFIFPFLVSFFCATHTISDEIVGSGFYNSFDWQIIPDGVDKTMSPFASSNTFILRCDAKTGEVDVVEGVNDQGPNTVSLHTSAVCTMPAPRQQTGTPTQLDCNTNINGGTGCGVLRPSQKKIGPTFNQNGGGWSATAIKVWFGSRTECSVPNDVRPGNLAGVPSAYFPNTTCDLAGPFSDHYIINLPFCERVWEPLEISIEVFIGWQLGGAIDQSGCQSTCIDYVNKNPSSFVDTYFDFASLPVL